MKRLGTRRRWLASKWPLWLLPASLLAACSTKSAFEPNLAPETTLFVQGPVDTVLHKVHLYWFGTDADGEVVSFEFRMLNPDTLSDSAWVSTRSSDSLFSVYTPNGYTNPVFEVRAIDNQGLRDPTPARQLFQFRNQAPVVTIGPYPVSSDTTYYSLTLSWVGIDPDGDAGALRYRVWLNGNEGNARTTSARTFTVPSEDFVVGPAADSIRRRVYVQAVDEGGMAGTPAVREWVVRRPTLGGGPPRLLIVDDVRPVNTLNFRTDTLWTNGAVRNLPPGTWSVLRLEFTQPFRSAKDVEQTFRQYDSVIWYRGTENNFALTLSQIQDGIGAAMDGGTSVLIEGLNLLGVEFATGPLRLDFISRYFETDYLYKHFMAGMVDSSITWGVPIGGVFRSGPVIPTDSLRIQIIASGLHGFALADTHDVLLWARAGTLSQPHSFDVPVAISVPQASGATATLVTLPVVATSAPSNIQRATIFVNNVFQHVLRFGP